MSAPDPLAARRGALVLLRASLERQSMLDEGALPASLPGPERARALTLARETMRWMGAADAVIARFVKRMPAVGARTILRLGTMELLARGAPAHAVVDACVRLAKKDRKGARQAGMINAVLRRVAEDGPAIWAELDRGRLSTPDWLWRELRADWGKGGARAIASAHLTPAPLDLTVKDDPAGWAERLGGTVTPSGSVRLDRPGQVTALEGYETGDWWAQDAAAAIPAKLAGPGTGRAALDLCAAPGGKTMQLAASGWAVTALDNDAARLARVAENLARTKLQAELVEADALDWDDVCQFDLVLLDAPCTATGTIRRHPELPHIRDGAGLTEIGAMQEAMVGAAWRRVAPGGMLIYCTCSLNRAEGEARVAAFLDGAEDAARAEVTAAETGDLALVTRQGDYRARPDFWPEIGGMDGFFASRIVKRA